LAISLRKPERLYLTTGVINANTVVITPATEKEYTVRNVDGIYITVGIGIAEI
jgi:hypothetical protein